MTRTQVLAFVQARNERREAALADRATAALDTAEEHCDDVGWWLQQRGRVPQHIAKATAYLIAMDTNQRDTRRKALELACLGQIELRPCEDTAEKTYKEVEMLASDRDVWARQALAEYGVALEDAVDGEGIDPRAEEAAIAAADKAAAEAFANYSPAPEPARPHELAEVETMAIVARSRPDPDYERLVAQCRRLLEYAAELQKIVPAEEPPAVSELRKL